MCEKCKGYEYFEDILERMLEEAGITDDDQIYVAYPRDIAILIEEEPTGSVLNLLGTTKYVTDVGASITERNFHIPLGVSEAISLSAGMINYIGKAMAIDIANTESEEVKMAMLNSVMDTEEVLLSAIRNLKEKVNGEKE